jgi:hypothetical protein
MLRVPRDINLDSSIKSVPMSGESPKADNPLTPNTEKSMLGSSKPPSLGGAQTPPSTGGAPSSFDQASPSSSPVGASSSSKPTESPKTSPPSPQSHGLRSAGEYPLGGNSFIPHLEKQPRQYSWVDESLTDNPEFVKARFHIGRFITVVVGIKADQANMKVLYSNLEFALTCLNVSTFQFPHYTILSWF